MDRQSEIPMDMSRIQQLAQSPAGKKLIAMLQQYGGIADRRGKRCWWRLFSGKSSIAANP